MPGQHRGKIEADETAIAHDGAAVHDRAGGLVRAAQHQRRDRVPLRPPCRWCRGGRRRGRPPCPAPACRCRRGPARARRRAWRSRAPARGHPGGALAQALDEQRWRASFSRWPLSLEAEPSTPSPTGTPASSIAPHRGDAAGEAHVRGRAVRDSGAGRPNRPISRSSSCTQCACHTSGPIQPTGFRVVARPHAELLLRVGDVLHVLGSVRVQADLVLAGQQRRCRASARG